MIPFHTVPADALIEERPLSGEMESTHRRKYIPDPGRERMNYAAINIKEKLGMFSEHWSPKIIARMNDCHFKLVKLQGDFVWHRHDSTDEVFLVLEGVVRIDFRDGEVKLKPGEMFVVQRGVEHKPYSENESMLMLIEPAGTINTGDAGGGLTAEDNVWI